MSRAGSYYQERGARALCWGRVNGLRNMCFEHGALPRMLPPTSRPRDLPGCADGVKGELMGHLPPGAVRD
eukprot:4979372-Alexandrium_andersonii.AAC.1